MTTPRVAVVGGGAIGTSAAFHLARAGVEVELFERDSVASGSTGRALGGVRYLFAHPLSVAAMAHGIDFFERFGDETGIDLQFERDGYLYVFRNEAVEERWRSRVEYYREHGFDPRVLSPAEVRDVCDMVDVSGLRGGLFAPECGFVDPHSVADAFARAASDHGATVRTGAAVNGIAVEDGVVRGVDTDSGRHDADVVLNAAGPWAGEVARTAGVDLPLSFVKSGFMRLESDRRESGPFVVDEALGARFRVGGVDELYVGLNVASIEGPDAPLTVSTEDRLAALDTAAELAPELGERGVVDEWTGVLTTTPDGHPLLGPVGPEGHLVAGGFSGHGLMLAPPVGRALADCVREGRSDVMDLEALSPRRFEAGTPLESEGKFAADESL